MGPQMNKFEQVSGDGHQMSLAGVRLLGSMSNVCVWGVAGLGSMSDDLISLVRGGQWVPCSVRSNASWVMSHGDSPVNRKT